MARRSDSGKAVEDLVTGYKQVGLGTPTRHPSAGTECSHGMGTWMGEQRMWAANRQLALVGIKGSVRTMFSGENKGEYHS